MGENMISYLRIMIIDERGINNEIEKNLDRFVNVGRSCSNVCGYA